MGARGKTDIGRGALLIALPHIAGMYDFSPFDKSRERVRIVVYKEGKERMPQTVPVEPPSKPRETPSPERVVPPPKPRRELDPFNPDWPKTRPTPEPKA
jgi:hypothetical protein